MQGTLQTDRELFDAYHLHFAVPSNMLLNKLGKPSLYLPSCMVVWGIISGATAASQTYGGLLACRFILGFVEAAYFVSPSHSPSISLQDYNDTNFGIAWMSLLPLSMVYQKRTCKTYRSFILRFSPLRCLLRSHRSWHHRWS
jgi:hypothetical protein